MAKRSKLPPDFQGLFKVGEKVHVIDGTPYYRENLVFGLIRAVWPDDECYSVRIVIPGVRTGWQPINMPEHYLRALDPLDLIKERLRNKK